MTIDRPVSCGNIFFENELNQQGHVPDLDLGVGAAVDDVAQRVFSQPFSSSSALPPNPLVEELNSRIDDLFDPAETWNRSGQKLQEEPPKIGSLLANSEEPPASSVGMESESELPPPLLGGSMPPVPPLAPNKLLAKPFNQEKTLSYFDPPSLPLASEPASAAAPSQGKAVARPSNLPKAKVKRKKEKADVPGKDLSIIEVFHSQLESLDIRNQWHFARSWKRLLLQASKLGYETDDESFKEWTNAFTALNQYCSPKISEHKPILFLELWREFKKKCTKEIDPDQESFLKKFIEKVSGTKRPKKNEALHSVVAQRRLIDANRKIALRLIEVLPEKTEPEQFKKFIDAFVEVSKFVKQNTKQGKGRALKRPITFDAIWAAFQRYFTGEFDSSLEDVLKNFTAATYGFERPPLRKNEELYTVLESLNSQQRSLADWPALFEQLPDGIDPEQFRKWPRAITAVNQKIISLKTTKGPITFDTLWGVFKKKCETEFTLDQTNVLKDFLAEKYEDQIEEDTDVAEASQSKKRKVDSDGASSASRKKQKVEEES